VKPGNVLIDRTQHVFLADFGLSKNTATRGITTTGQWMGTAEYMAPEQAQGGSLDYRADLYALGCVAFECLTGDPPYLAENPFAVMMAHANSQIPRATQHNSSLHTAVDDVLERAMSKAPQERYPSAVALIESLECAIGGGVLTPAAEPAEGFKRYTGPQTPPPPPKVPIEEQPTGWPTSAPPSGPTTLFCPNCVGPVERDDLFCGTCGVRIMWCQSCNGPRAGHDRFCPHCGATSAAGPNSR
jgi:serine/threonine-protein kinase